MSDYANNTARALLGYGSSRVSDHMNAEPSPTLGGPWSAGSADNALAGYVTAPAYQGIGAYILPTTCWLIVPEYTPDSEGPHLCRYRDAFDGVVFVGMYSYDVNRQVWEPLLKVRLKAAQSSGAYVAGVLEYAVFK